MINKKFISLIIAFLIAVPSIYAGNFITAKEAKKLLKDDNVQFISAQKESNYKNAHLKGSIFVDHQKLYRGGDYAGVLNPSFKLKKYLGGQGVDANKTLIIYDDGKNKYNTRLYWIFKYLGVKDVKLLHKNMNEWRSARLPLTSTPTNAKPTTFAAKPNNNLIINTAALKTKIGDANSVIVDARAADEFKGETDDSDGHIKGAVNVNWEDLTTSSGALKSKSELQSIFNKAGVTKGKEVILYCATSVRAGMLFYVLTEELGYSKVKVYDGALVVWSKNPANPIEK